jgi:hypothetical protein
LCAIRHEEVGRNDIASYRRRRILSVEKALDPRLRIGVGSLVFISISYLFPSRVMSPGAAETLLVVFDFDEYVPDYKS